MVWQLRKQWGIGAIRARGQLANPPRWQDGSYTVEALTTRLGVCSRTIYQWLRDGRLQGRQAAKGMPWRVIMTDEQVAAIRARATRSSRSKREAL